MPAASPVAMSVIVLFAVYGAQTPSTPKEVKQPSGSISGRVTIGGEGAPGVVVALQAYQASSPSPPAATATTDEQGSFRLTVVPAGRYTILPLAPALVMHLDEGPGLPHKLITLSEGETVEGIDLALSPGGVITGRVKTAAGWPVIAEEIVVTLVNSSGQKRFPFPFTTDLPRFKTDDRGVYRIYGLPAGRYLVSVTGIQRSQHSSYPETYYPGVTEESRAKLVEVAEGGETDNVDITLGRAPQSFDVSGRVIDGATGRPISNVRVDYSSHSGYYRSGPPTDANGGFRFNGLSSGRYTVSIPISSGSEFSGDAVSFEVTDRDVTGLEIKTRRAASISGTITVEGADDPAIVADLSHLTIWLSRVAGGLGTQAQASSDGRFRIPGLPADKYRLLCGSRTGRKGFSLLRVERDGVLQRGGIEVADGEQVGGLRLVIGYGTGVVRGEVKVEGGALPGGSRMYVSGRPLSDVNPEAGYGGEVDARGHFVIEGLPAGDYQLTLTIMPPAQIGQPRTPRLGFNQTVTAKNGAESFVTFAVKLKADGK